MPSVDRVIAFGVCPVEAIGHVCRVPLPVRSSWPRSLVIVEPPTSSVVLVPVSVPVLFNPNVGQPFSRQQGDRAGRPELDVHSSAVANHTRIHALISYEGNAHVASLLQDEACQADFDTPPDQASILSRPAENHRVCVAPPRASGSSPSVSNCVANRTHEITCRAALKNSWPSQPRVSAPS